jgi:hypothetical protein
LIIVVVGVTIPSVKHIKARVLCMLTSHRRVDMTALSVHRIVVVSLTIHDQDVLLWGKILLVYLRGVATRYMSAARGGVTFG